MLLQLNLISAESSKAKSFKRLFDRNLSDSEKVNILDNAGFSRDEMRIKAEYPEDQKFWQQHDIKAKKLLSGNASEEEKKQWLEDALTGKEEYEIKYRKVDIWNCDDISVTFLGDDGTQYNFDLGDPILEDDVLRFLSQLSAYFGMDVRATLRHEDDLECINEYNFPDDSYDLNKQGEDEELPDEFYSNLLKIIAFSIGTLSLVFLVIFAISEVSIPWWACALSYIVIPAYFILAFAGQDSHSKIKAVSVLKAFLASSVSLIGVYLYYNQNLGKDYSQYLLYASIPATILMMVDDIIVWLKGDLETTFLENLVIYGLVAILINGFAVAAFLKTY